MKNYRKINAVLMVCWAVIFAVVLTLVFNQKQPEMQTDASETTTVESVIKQEEIIGDKKDVTSRKENTTLQGETTITANAPTVTLENEAIDTEIPVTEDLNIRTVEQYYWYLCDYENYDCYAFKFNENGNKVDLAYFSSETIKGLDPEYTTGYAVYKISGDEISIKNLPDEFPIKHFKLTVKNGKVYSGQMELVPADDMSLQSAILNFD